MNNKLIKEENETLKKNKFNYNEFDTEIKKLSKSFVQGIIEKSLEKAEREEQANKPISTVQDI